MADEFIWMRASLRTDPQVGFMAARFGVPVEQVTGALFVAWCIASEHGNDGFVPAQISSRIDEHVGLQGFLLELERIGWIEHVRGGVQFVNREYEFGPCERGSV